MFRKKIKSALFAAALALTATQSLTAQQAISKLEGIPEDQVVQVCKAFLEGEERKFEDLVTFDQAKDFLTKKHNGSYAYNSQRFIQICNNFTEGSADALLKLALEIKAKNAVRIKRFYDYLDSYARTGEEVHISNANLELRKIRFNTSTLIAMHHYAEGKLPNETPLIQGLSGIAIQVESHFMRAYKKTFE